MGSKRKRRDPVEPGGTNDPSSGGESSDDEVETPMYACRKCDNKVFTAEELGDHRRWHKETKHRAKVEVPGTTSPRRSPRPESLPFVKRRRKPKIIVEFPDDKVEVVMYVCKKCDKNLTYEEKVAHSCRNKRASSRHGGSRSGGWKSGAEGILRSEGGALPKRPWARKRKI